MSEINGPKFSVNQVNYSGIQKAAQTPVPDEAEEQAPKLTDFSDPKAEALGRSMLIKDADDINHDLKALIENPQIAENSDEIFETTYQAFEDAGIENPYEQASTVSTGTV